jgi:hypothetical protein
MRHLHKSKILSLSTTYSWTPGALAALKQSLLHQAFTGEL